MLSKKKHHDATAAADAGPCPSGRDPVPVQLEDSESDPLSSRRVPRPQLPVSATRAVTASGAATVTVTVADSDGVPPGVGALTY